MNLPINEILQGDALSRLKDLPAKSVHCMVTSPPYWGLRDYGIPPTEWPVVNYKIFGKKFRIKKMTCCLGLEATPEAFIAHMVLIFRECMRVLRDDGTLWVNMGDSYASTAKNKTDLQQTKNYKQVGGLGHQLATKKQPNKIVGMLKPKDLVGIPWMLAFALRDDGWYLRQDDIWHKSNPMPESVDDRCTKSHEYIFQLNKKGKYYYDAEAISVPLAESTQRDKRTLGSDFTDNRPNREFPGVQPSQGAGMLKPKFTSNTVGVKKHKNVEEKGQPVHTMHRTRNDNGTEWTTETGRANKRSVWTISTKPFAEAHFATFPQEIPEICIKASTSEHGCCKDCGTPYKRIFIKELVPTIKASYNSNTDNRDINADSQDQGSNRQKDGHKPGWANRTETKGWQKQCKCETAEVVPAIVADMFFGAGTTGLVARKLQRNFIGIEISDKYITIAENRLQKELGLFL